MSVTLGAYTLPNPHWDSMQPRMVETATEKEMLDGAIHKRAAGWHWEWDYTWRVPTSVKNNIVAACQAARITVKTMTDVDGNSYSVTVRFPIELKRLDVDGSSWEINVKIIEMTSHT